MEVNAERLADGRYLLDLGPVSFHLDGPTIEQLNQVVSQRLHQSDETEAAALQKKLNAYRKLAQKLVSMDDRVLQKLLPQLSPEQTVTLVRLSTDGMYDKVCRNFSRQNAKQFEDDYQAFDKITLHQATLYMEQMMPMIKQAAQEQKKLQAQAV